MSERDGWAHLYLMDGATGAIKNQITKGNWLVRGVQRVDEANKQIVFGAAGMNPKQDPYFLQYYRINFDGSGLTPLTDADGYHTVTFSSDNAYYVDTWSRPGLPIGTDEGRAGDHGAPARRHDGARKSRMARAEGARVQGARRHDGHLGDHRSPVELRPEEEVPGDREHLRGAAGLVRAEDVRPMARHAVHRGARLHRRADRRHGNRESLQGVPRRGVEEPRRRGLPRSHPLAQGRGGEVSVVRHLPRRHLRRFGRRTELARRAALPSGVLQGGGLVRRLPRQQDGQGLVERTLDGLARRSVI